MGNYKLFFRMGSAFVLLGAILFVTAFFIPENETIAVAADEANNIERAVGLDMNYRNSNSEVPANSLSDEYIPELITDEEIMKRAEELGMIFEPSEAELYYPDNLNEAGSNAVNVIIQRGAGAFEIAILLEAAGVVEDSVRFSNFILSEGMERRINAGEYYIEKGLDYRDVLRIISGTYRLRGN